MSFSSASPRSPSRDFSGFGIVASNLLVIVFALVEDWSLGSMMGIYWAQSVIIGIFQFARILCLKSFSTKGFTSNGSPVPETPQGKRGTAFFFAVHYGIFHLVYLIFLLTGKGGGGADTGVFWFAVSVLAFLVSHALSFSRNVRADRSRRPHLGALMFLPYARILPMHLTLILGQQLDSNTLSLILFTSLKTGADYLMHVVEHRALQKGAEPVPTAPGEPG